MLKPSKLTGLENLNKAFVWLLPAGVGLIFLGFYLIKKFSREEFTAVSTAGETTLRPAALPEREAPFPLTLPTGVAPTGMQDLSVPAALAAALRAEQTRHFDVAVWCYAHVWKKNPRTPDLLYHLATLALRRDELVKGRELLEASLARGEQKVSCHNLLGLYYQENGRPDEAREQYTRAIQSDGTDAQGYFNLGDLMRQKGETGPALENLAFAVKLKPDNPYYLLKLNLARIEAGQTEGLSAKTEMQLLMEPNSAPWLMISAALALKNDQPQVAATQLAKVRTPMNAGLFQHVLKDAVFQHYAALPEISSFYLDKR
jgi:tetratricopeptide (TPR) repeat protein